MALGFRVQTFRVLDGRFWASIALKQGSTECGGLGLGFRACKGLHGLPSPAPPPPPAPFMVLFVSQVIGIFAFTAN